MRALTYEFSTPPTRREATRARQRWLCDYTGMPEAAICLLWDDADTLKKERGDLANLPDASFLQVSSQLGTVLLRREVESYNYYNALCRALRLCEGVQKGAPVLFFGLTAGAEVEVIKAAGGVPHLCMPYGSARLMCEERLFDGRIDWVSVRYETDIAPGSYFYIVVSDALTLAEGLHTSGGPDGEAHDVARIVAPGGLVFCRTGGTVSRTLAGLGLLRRNVNSQHVDVLGRLPDHVESEERYVQV